MKKISSFLILLLIMLHCSFASAEETAVLVAQDDFDNYTPGVDFVETASPYKYSTSKAGVCFVQNDGTGNGNHIYYDGRGGYGQGIQIKFKSAPIVTIRFQYKLDSGITDGAHFYCGSTINAELDRNPTYYITRDGKLSTGSMNGTITSGVWHDIICVLNIEKQYFDFYVDGAKIGRECLFRGVNQSATYANIFLNDANPKNKQFSVRKVRVYHGEIIPEMSEYAASIAATAEKPLTSIATPTATVSAAIPSAYAMFAGYPVAYSAGKYETVAADNHLAPVYSNGYVFAPASYVAKALGGTYANGTITAGGASATFAEGATSDICPVAPVMVADELYVPVTDKLASYFGSCAYVDERGLAFIGLNVTPGEQVIKSLLFNLRTNSSIFGEGVKSEVLFCTRSWYNASETRKAGYDSLDATKRFMSTSIRWTYHTSESNIKRLRDLGSDVQSGLNAVPVKLETDQEGNTLYYTHSNGQNYPIYTGASYDFDGNLRVRSDGLGGWGCTNNPQFLEDLIGKAKAGIDIGQYLWQFDDHTLNAAYGCYCDYCMEAFTKWLKEECGYTTYRDLYEKHGAGNLLTVKETYHTWLKYTEYTISGFEAAEDKRWIYYETETKRHWLNGNYISKVTLKETDKLNTPIEQFNYKEYLTDLENIKTNSEASSYYTGSARLGPLYKKFSLQKVHEYHEKLRGAMDEYAAQKGLTIHMSHNISNNPANVKSQAFLYDIMDSGMGETEYKYTLPGGVYATRIGEQVFGKRYVNSLWVRKGKTTMQLWASAVPLMYATGQNSLIPWDDWVYNSSRFYCDLEELEGNYAFVREYPHLFDNYEAPCEVGYIIDADANSDFTNAEIQAYGEALGKKGIASKFIGQRGNELPYHSIEAQDLNGIKALCAVDTVTLSDAENTAIANAGLTVNEYRYTYDTALIYQDWEKDYWTARISGMPANLYAVLRQNTLYKNAPVVVHTVNFETATQKNVNVEINNKYLPEGDSFTIKFYAPGKNTYTKTVARASGEITTVTVDSIENWVVMEIFGANSQSIARFDVEGFSGIGLGSRVSYDSAKGNADSFTITTYGEGVNCYTTNDKAAGQDEAGFVYKYVEEDDFEISASIEAVAGQSGLMLREGVWSNAASVILMYDSNEGLKFGKRDITNSAYFYKKVGTEMPAYMKLTCVNSQVTVWSSDDGEQWTNLGTMDIFFKPGVAGVFATSEYGTITDCTASDVEFVQISNDIGYDITSVNLMDGRNPGFVNGLLEDYVLGFDSIYNGAGSLGAKAAVAKVSPSKDYDGNCLKLTAREDGSEGVWYRYLPIENGKTYEASMWMKVDAGASETASLAAELPPIGEVYNSNTHDGTVSVTIDASNSVQLSEEWQRVFVRFTVSETGLAKGINVRALTTGTSDIYIDAIELKEVHKVGEFINASYIDYGDRAVLDISSSDNAPHVIKYSVVQHETGEDGVRRVKEFTSQPVTVTDETQSFEIAGVNLGDVSEIYLWDDASISPIVRTIRERKIK